MGEAGEWAKVREQRLGSPAFGTVVLRARSPDHQQRHGEYWECRLPGQPGHPVVPHLAKTLFPKKVTVPGSRWAGAGGGHRSSTGATVEVGGRTRAGHPTSCRGPLPPLGWCARVLCGLRVGGSLGQRGWGRCVPVLVVGGRGSRRPPAHPESLTAGPAVSLIQRQPS